MNKHAEKLFKHEKKRELHKKKIQRAGGTHAYEVSKFWGKRTLKKGKKQ